FQPTDSAHAIFRTEEKIVDDSTAEMKIFLINGSIKVQEAKGIKSSDGKQHNYYKQYDLKGILVSEAETVNAKTKRAVKYHPNGVKAEELIYGDIDLPIKSTRWDENGTIIP
ncbi:MAG: hypothetical protein DI598_05080, partial [Pseudopedobacter saltans]